MRVDPSQVRPHKCTSDGGSIALRETMGDEQRSGMRERRIGRDIMDRQLVIGHGAFSSTQGGALELPDREGHEHN